MLGRLNVGWCLWALAGFVFMRGCRNRDGGRPIVRQIASPVVRQAAQLSWLAGAIVMPRRQVVKCARLILRHYKGNPSGFLPVEATAVKTLRLMFGRSFAGLKSCSVD